MVQPVPPRPPSLDHFAIFNPSKRKTRPQGLEEGLAGSTLSEDSLSQSERTGNITDTSVNAGGVLSTAADTADTADTAVLDNAQPTAQDLDLEDDLREASQILFYTSKTGSVSRDTMLKQVGLVRGLMGFTEMVTRDKTTGDNDRGDRDGSDTTDYWSFRSHRSRMIVYSPRPDLYIYANIKLSTLSPQPTEPRTTRIKSTQDLKAGSTLASKAEPAPTSQGLSDQVLVQGLRRGFQEFELLQGPFTDDSSSSSTSSSSSAFEKFWTQFTYDFESTYLSPFSPLELCSDGIRAIPLASASKVHETLKLFAAAYSVDDIGIISPSGSYNLSSVDPTLIRWLVKILHLAQPPSPDPASPKTTSKPDDRKSSWSTLGLSWVPTLGGSRSVTPTKPSNLSKIHGTASLSVRSSGESDPMLKAKASRQSMMSGGGGHSRMTSLDSPSSTPRLPPSTMGKDPGSGESASRGLQGTEHEEDKDDKWGFGLGLGGLTDAMGSLKPGLDMGNLFRFGTSPAPSAPETDPHVKQIQKESNDEPSHATATEDNAESTMTVSLNDPIDGYPSQLDSLATTTGIRSSLEVEPRPGLLPDLEAASTHEIDLGWTSRTVYLRPPRGVGNAFEIKVDKVAASTSEGSGNGPGSVIDDVNADTGMTEADLPLDGMLVQYTVSWIIRDTILLYLLTPFISTSSSTSTSKSPRPPIPSTETVLSLYSSLSSILSAPPISAKSPRASSDHTRDPTWTYSSPSTLVQSNNLIPKTSQDVLLGLKDWAMDERIDEVLVKTSSDFLALKRLDLKTNPNEDEGEDDKAVVALSLGRKDASLTDADYAMRGFIRSHPDLVG